MDRRAFVVTSAGALLALSPGLRAQGLPPRRIAYLSAFSRADVDTAINQLRPELERLGWVEGRNIVFLPPLAAEGRNELLPSMAGEVVALGPDLILVSSAPATRALMQVTKTIPIVMIGVGNPVEYGMVADLGKPGGNITGSTYLADESARKLLQLLREAAPRLRSVALFANPSNEAAAALVRQVRADGVDLGLQVQILEVSGKGDFVAAFAAIRRANTESIVLPPEALIRSNVGAIADFAQAQGIPLAVVGSSRALPASGLMAYGPNFQQYPPITARYVDRILKGARPGELPVEQPSRFDLTINLKTAKALGLTIPQALQLRADELIQ